MIGKVQPSEKAINDGVYVLLCGWVEMYGVGGWVMYANISQCTTGCNGIVQVAVLFLACLPFPRAVSCLCKGPVLHIKTWTLFAWVDYCTDWTGLIYLHSRLLISLLTVRAAEVAAKYFNILPNGVVCCYS